MGTLQMLMTMAGYSPVPNRPSGGLQTPGPGSPAVLLSQDIMRRRTNKKKQNPFLTGGLAGTSATLSQAALRGLV
ncbi:MAG: hypothetical protein WC977_11785 [Anaerovoracaceae bacterium]